MKSKKIRISSMLLVLVMLFTMIPIMSFTSLAAEEPAIEPKATLVEQTIQLFNSGKTSSSGYAYSTDYDRDMNPASSTLDNNGYDLYGCASSKPLTFRMGLPFTIEEEITEWAKLYVYAYDIDSPERDEVYLVDETDGSRVNIGVLKGFDSQWTDTYINIDPENFTKGHTYHFEVKIAVTGWYIWIRQVALTITAPEPDPDPEQLQITDLDFSATIDKNGTIDTLLTLKTNRDAALSVDYIASTNDSNVANSLENSMTGTPEGATKSLQISLPNTAPKGVYTISASIRDAKTGNMLRTIEVDAGYKYSAVSYNSNGGSSNIPTDSVAYSAGDTVTALFNKIPSKPGHTFLGWSPYKNALYPLFVNGNNKFTFVRTGGTSFTVSDEFGNSENINAKIDFANKSVSFVDSNGTSYAFKYVAGNMEITVYDSTGCMLVAEIESLVLAGTIPAEAVVVLTPSFIIGDTDVTLYAIWKADACVTHTYIETGRVDSTCTEKGKISYACTVCGETDEKEIDLKPHEEGEWIIDTEATCRTSGFKHTECVDCGATVHSAYIKPLSHNYVSAIIKPVTCEEAGIIEHTCSMCQFSYTTYIYSEHNWKEVSRTDATCTTDGQIVYKCQVNGCGKEYIQPINGGHIYTSEVIKKATDKEEGIIRYTCSICQHSYDETTPIRPMATVLLVQDRLPWTEYSNTDLLNKLQQNGYISGWDLTSTSNFTKIDVSDYDIIFIANDQTTATYNQLKKFNETIVNFAKAGGVVVYGACDHGWGSGNISYSLPGGVTKDNYYSYYNYIVNSDHQIVTGSLTDGKSLTNSVLYSTYASHTYFKNLPEDTVVILEDAKGMPTLIEYPMGDGYIIASGLTWEYTYVRNYVNGTSFAKNVYDDVLVYAAMIGKSCDHAFDEGVKVDVTCTTDGYTLHTCAKCNKTYKDNIVTAPGHTPGAWTEEKAATAYETGLAVLRCTVCGEKIGESIIPIANAPYAIIKIVEPAYTVNNKWAVIGNKITFSVKITNADLAKNLGIELIFDDQVFKFDSYDFNIDSLIQNFDENYLRAAYAWSEGTDINTYVFTFTLIAENYSPSTTISCNVLLENGTKSINVTPVVISVIDCPHPGFGNTIQSFDDEYHKMVCSICGYTEVQKHIYDNVCDTTCNKCDHVRIAPHNPHNNWSVDANEHWHECSDCGKKLDNESHKFTCWTDENDAHSKSCEICGYTVRTSHRYSAWEDTGDTHTRTCLDCGHIESIKHSFTAWTDAGDEHTRSCTACGKTETAKHSYGAWVDNGLTHSHTCADCGKTVSEDHSFTPWESNGNMHARKCTVCNKTESQAHCHDHWDMNDAEHWHVCTVCEEILDLEKHTYTNAIDGICNDCGYQRFIRGDFDNDGDVDSDDSIYLLYYIVYDYTDPAADKYWINQPADIDGNGKVNANDAIYLLNFVIFGADYPLH